MATSQATEMQIEGKVDVDEAVKRILAEVEAEEQDPIEGMGNAQVAEIYQQMKPMFSACSGNLKGFTSSITRPTGMMPQATS